MYQAEIVSGTWQCDPKLSVAQSPQKLGIKSWLYKAQSGVAIWGCTSTPTFSQVMPCSAIRTKVGEEETKSVLLPKWLLFEYWYDCVFRVSNWLCSACWFWLVFSLHVLNKFYLDPQAFSLVLFLFSPFSPFLHCGRRRVVVVVSWQLCGCLTSVWGQATTRSWFRV